MIKHIVKYPIIFMGVLIVLTGLLAASAMVPKSAIEKNILDSAEYLYEDEIFGTVVKGVESSRIDRYADAILLGIAYQYDSEHPLESVMRSSYYHTDWLNENENLYIAVTQNKEENFQYLRYWHGSNVLVRPLLVFFTISQLYKCNGIVLVVLAMFLLGILCKKKAYVPMVGIIVGLISTSVWFVPLSLEYTWTYLLMLAGSIVAVKMAYQKQWGSFGVLFMVMGMLTNFMDFLVTETLTITVPLLLTLWIIQKLEPDAETKRVVTFSIKSILAWGCGYVCMWVSKWVLATIVLRENVLPYVMEHITERIDGNMSGKLVEKIIITIWKNMKCLFPFEYDLIGLFLGIGFIIFVVYIGYVYYNGEAKKKNILMYILIGSVPYIRYAVLHNHAYYHHFFTFRAQFAVVLAIVLILEVLTARKGLS